MTAKGVAVMRRRADAWVNATQILKVAGLDKPQRTRVLERDIQKQTHEKVQGGYGKYQGTWVPLDRAVAIAQSYNVDHLLRGLFDYVPTSMDSPPLAPKHSVAAPSRKRKVEQHDPPSGRGKTGAPSMPPPMAASASSSQGISAGTAALLRRTATMDSVRSDSEAGRRRSSYSATSASRTPSPAIDRDGSGGSDDDYDGTGDPIVQREVKPRARAAPRASGASTRRVRVSAAATFEDELPVPAQLNAGQYSAGTNHYSRQILDYFVNDSNQVPEFLNNPPADFDPNVVIDEDGHTALHWAAAMSRIRVVKLLIAAGADLFRANAQGQTALMRSVQFTNSYDLRRFHEMFELLHRSSINIDRRDRSVFHYILDLALTKGKMSAARYYLQTVLQRLSEYPHEVAEILNYQDEDGETALTLAARARSKRLVRMLIEAGASPRIRNHEGKSAEDYITEDARQRADSPSASGPTLFAAKTHVSETARQAQTTAMPQISELLENLGATYDAGIETHDRELSHTLNVIQQLEAELSEGPQLNAGSVDMPALEARERELEGELDQRMAKRFRLGYEKYTQDEDERETALQSAGEALPADLAELYTAPGSPGETAELQRDLQQLRSDREGMFAEYIRRVKASGPEAVNQPSAERMDRLRRLVSAGTGQPLETIDQAVPSLLEAFEAGQLSAR